ncbi:metallophosphoesterase [Scytonema sp. HK-05]|uniref:metallophosphoesterase family protein n=1 Tax=Scytonema sp. HK-05 TaxID=1137095 RepID=UPI0009359197|nr:metallophosphoesterase [Scytonema sp. HK-05]OKH60961.1 metallophosphoesterase [Scytonema sp. HK-05]BAY46333.1 metallophosphoesterase [Scytonema sp. HK-05]
MKWIFDPPIPVKIQKMKERVRWRHPSVVQRRIDQTSMVIHDDNSDNPEFSFIVIGDSGTTEHHGHHPQRRIAELMLGHREECRFVLHTGDVIYVVGSHEYYPTNFIEPYREFLVGGENPKRISYDGMVFNLPILPVLGNHDYYDVPLMYRLLAGSTLLLRRFFRYKDIEIGWHGSYQGDAYARAFLDYITALAPDELEHHLDNNYTAKTDTGRCLRYEPGRFTRLPNRYYTFRYGGIDFFALDSNTFNAPLPLPATKEGEAERRELVHRQHEIEQEEMQILEACSHLNPDVPEQAEQLDALKAKLYQIDEIKIDIEKQLESHKGSSVDFEQLNWLKQRLIQSWNSEEVRGRILYFHHPPYVTEKTKWRQAQTLAVRRRLRWVFDEVADTLGSLTKGRPIVDLILNGHAHCLEHLRTVDTGHADSFINCIISGGSGHYPRRQRKEGSELMETFEDSRDNHTRKVAESLLFVGRNGYDEQKRLPYSFVRIDVKDGNPPKFIVRPYVAERFQGEWSDRQLEPFVI